MAQTRTKLCPCRGQTLDRLLQPALLALLAVEGRSGYQLLQRLAQTRMFGENPPDPAGARAIVLPLSKASIVQT